MNTICQFGFHVSTQMGTSNMCHMLIKKEKKKKEKKRSRRYMFFSAGYVHSDLTIKPPKDAHLEQSLFLKLCVIIGYSIYL